MKFWQKFNEINSKNWNFALSPLFYDRASNIKPRNSTLAQYPKEFIYEVISNLVQGLVRNGFRQTDRQTKR